MTNRVAIIDLGTNTFHLLIGEEVDGNMQYMLRRTEPVKLGEGGINDGIIRPAPFERGIKCLESFACDIDKFEVAQTRAIATSAIRNAKNGQDFIEAAEKKSGILIETIDGSQEAKFIYQGIKASKCLAEQDSLIMDIGGGSVEFIIGNIEGIKWKQSFEIGAARMMGLFHQVDPLPQEALKDLHQWLEGKLDLLFEAIKTCPVSHLIGSSGSFETFAEMIEAAKGNELDISSIKSYGFEIDCFYRMAAKLIKSSHEERFKMKVIIPLRIDMIVTASVLTQFVMEKLEIDKLSMSTYSLKEGVLEEMFDLT